MKINEIKEKSNPIDLRGINLKLVTNCHFDSLFKHFPFKGKKREALISLERLYSHFYTLLENDQDISRIKEENDKVVFDENSYFHITPMSLKNLISISEIGLVASEWFGQLESHREACFCTFLNRYNSLEEDAKTGGRIAYYNYFLNLTSDNNVWLFFDGKNKYMKELLDLDFFDYQRIKKDYPDLINSLYPENVLNIYENLILPLSPASSSFHDKFSDTYFWKSIPGGIPPMLINGICIGDDSKLFDKLDIIQELFPNATIFDGERNVLGYGKNIKNNIKKS